MNVFKEFVNAMERHGVIPCSRCGEPCMVGDPGNDEARLLRYENDPNANGLCANCAVTAWFKASPLAEMIDDPQKLLWEPLQKQFSELMKAGDADMKSIEISWELVVKNWDMPFPKTGKGKRKR